MKPESWRYRGKYVRRVEPVDVGNWRAVYLRLRKQLGVSQTAVAQFTGWPKRTVRGIEEGTTANVPRLETVQRLFEALGYRLVAERFDEDHGDAGEKVRRDGVWDRVLRSSGG